MSVAVSGHDSALLACIDDDLAQVEARLLAETRSDIGAVRKIAGHTLLSGGKRLRPAIAILGARSIGRELVPDRAYSAAAAVEMIHMATLMHDDVVDGAGERRGHSTASAVYGNAITVLTGDYLLAKSIYLLANDDENLQLVRLFAGVSVGMAEGEVLQASVARQLDIPVATYEDVIERKTARFLAGCCEAGGILGGADPAEAAALRAYGHHLGMAFQIADDLLDFLGDPSRTGKPLGTDLRDGRVTLPILYALDAASSGDARRLRLLLGGESIDDTQIAEVTRLLAQGGGFARARESAAERAERAISSIAHFRESVYHDALIRLARYVVARDH